MYENLKKAYGTQGFIQYTAEVTPTFKDNPQKPDEGIADFEITIDEGKQFTLRRLEFTGNTFTRDNVLRREVLINEGDIYNQNYFEFSVTRLNQLGYFNPIDKDKDADFRTNEEEGLVDVTVRVQEKGRQQISFNGGISGIGGSFFGLDYSTNNLFGRGEVLSVAWQPAIGSDRFSFPLPSRTSETGRSPRALPYLPIRNSFSVKAHSFRRTMKPNRAFPDRLSTSLTPAKRTCSRASRSALQCLPARLCLSSIASGPSLSFRASVFPISYPSRA